MKKSIMFIILSLMMGISDVSVKAGVVHDYVIDPACQTMRNIRYVISGLAEISGLTCLGTMGYLAFNRTPNSFSSSARVRSILQTLEDIGMPDVDANLLQFNGRHLAFLGITGTACLLLAAIVWPHAKKTQKTE